MIILIVLGFLGGSDDKESICNVGNPGSNPWSEIPTGGGHGNPLQYSSLENLMDREDWRTAVHRVAESCSAEQLCTP